MTKRWFKIFHSIRNFWIRKKKEKNNIGTNISYQLIQSLVPKCPIYCICIFAIILFAHLEDFHVMSKSKGNIGRDSATDK